MSKPSKGRYRVGWFSIGQGEAARDLFRTVWPRVKEGEIYLRIQQQRARRDGRKRRLFEIVRSYQTRPAAIVSLI